MATGKRYSTDYLVDSNNNTGSTGQVLTSTLTGIDWADIGSVPGGFWAEIGSDIYNTNSGNVGIGVTSPVTNLQITSSGSPSNPNASGTSLSTGSRLRFSTSGGASAVLDIGISSTPGAWIQARDATNFATLNYALLLNPNGGNVGIGTDDPDAKLHIYGNASLSEMYLGEDAAADKAGILKYTQGDGNGTGVITLSHWGDTSTTQSLAIKYGGNVGIGTTSPLSKLHVQSTSSSQQVILSAPDANNSWITFASGLSYKWMVGSNGHTAGNLFTIGQATGADTSNPWLAIQHTTGNVGIGVTAPSEKLEVNSGSIFVNGENNGIIVDSVSKRVGLMKYSGHEGVIARASTVDFGIVRCATSDIFDGSSLTYDLYVSGTGNVGIGTTDPQLKLHVNGGGALFGDIPGGGSVYVSNVNGNTINGAYGLNSDTGDLWLNYRGYLDGHTKFRDTRIGNGKGNMIVFVDGSTGNVGIADTSPDYRLSVAKVDAATPAIMVSGAFYGGPRIQTYGLDADSNAWMGLGTDMSGAGYEHNIYFPDYGGYGRLSMGTYNGTTYSEKMAINRLGAIRFNSYGAGTLVTDASGNITASSGGGAGGPFLPLAGGTMTGTSGIEIPEDFALKWKGTSTSTVVFEINNSGGTTTIQAGDGTNSHKFKIAVGDGGMEINPIGGGSIADFMSNKINLNQNVGIGVGSPDVPLDVAVTDGGSTFTDGAARFVNEIDTSTGGAGVLQIGNNYQGGFGTLIKFFFEGSSVASINFNNNINAVVYNTTSDYRLKEDLKVFNGLEIIDQIKTYDFRWKKSNDRAYGAIAHELQEIFPNAVTGEKDDIEMQGVDYSTLVPVLIKSIQELKIEIETIKQQLNN